MNIVELKKISDCDHLNLFSIRYKDRFDHEKSWVFASRLETPSVMEKEKKIITPDAVVVVPFHREKKKLVIIREFRVPLGEYQYGFPAGLVDRGENIEQAGKRELKEETGFDLVKIVKISPPVYSSSGMTDETISMLYAECTGEPSLEGNEDSEDIEVNLISRDEAAELLELPDIKFDVKSWIVLSHFADHGII